MSCEKKHLRRGSGLSSHGVLVLIAATFLTGACDAGRDIEISGNEAAAIKNLQTLAVNQRLYIKQKNGSAYGTFDQLIAEVNLDKRFAGDAPVVNGYVLTMKITPKAGERPAFFTINADPLRSEGTGATGKEHYYIDADSDTVKVNKQRPAGPDDPPVEQ